MLVACPNDLVTVAVVNGVIIFSAVLLGDFVDVGDAVVVAHGEMPGAGGADFRFGTGCANRVFECSLFVVNEDVFLFARFSEDNVFSSGNLS